MRFVAIVLNGLVLGKSGRGVSSLPRIIIFITGRLALAGWGSSGFFYIVLCGRQIDLTVSNIERQNALNNRYAVDALRESLGLTGMLFEREYRFTKKMVVDFYEVDLSTIDRYLSQYADELKHNGYVLSKGKKMKEFKLQFACVINEASKTTQFGLFNFRAVLNIGMLLTESESK